MKKKTCGGECGETKDITEFKKHRRCKDGYTTICRKCETKRRRLKRNGEFALLPSTILGYMRQEIASLFPSFERVMHKEGLSSPTICIRNEHERLFYSIIDCAISDLFGRKASMVDKQSARRYLLGEIWHAEKAGVDSDHIRLIIRKYDLEL